MNPPFQAFSTRAANSSSELNSKSACNPTLVVMADLDGLGYGDSLVRVMSPQNHRVLPVVLEADATQIQVVTVAA